MARASEEEYKEIRDEERHKEIVSAISSVGNREEKEPKDIEPLLREALDVLKKIAEKDDDSEMVDALKEVANRKEDLTPLVDAITSGLKNLPKVKEYTVERNNLGFIVKLIPVY